MIFFSDNLDCFKIYIGSKFILTIYSNTSHWEYLQNKVKIVAKKNGK